MIVTAQIAALKEMGIVDLDGALRSKCLKPPPSLAFLVGGGDLAPCCDYRVSLCIRIKGAQVMLLES